MKRYQTEIRVGRCLFYVELHQTELRGECLSTKLNAIENAFTAFLRQYPDLINSPQIHIKSELI